MFLSDGGPPPGGAISFVSALHLASGAFSYFVLHLHGVSFHHYVGELPCFVLSVSAEH